MAPVRQHTTTEQRRADAERALESELQRLVDSGEYAAWFAKMSSFHRYSPTNALWILTQRPDATRVASYRTWQHLGRYVRKGETGIMVLHPKPYWIDPTTGKRVRPPTTDAERARLDRHVSFGVGHVFDASQTDGEPLPELGRPAPAAAPKELAAHLEGYCRDNRITVDITNLPPGVGGYYQRDGDRIVLAHDAEAGERVATLAHELAHREDPELVAAHIAGDRSYYTHNRADCEAVAEATAHSVSARFKHDITGHSAGYIAGWVRGDVERFKQLHERVGQICRRLLPPDRFDLALTAAHTEAAIQAAQRAPASQRR